MDLIYTLVIVIIILLIFTIFKDNKNKREKKKNELVKLNEIKAKKNLYYYWNLYNNCGSNVNEITEEIVNADDKDLNNDEKNKLNIIKGNVYKYNYNDNKKADEYYTKFQFNKKNNDIDQIDNIDETDTFILNLILTESLDDYFNQQPVQLNQQPQGIINRLPEVGQRFPVVVQNHGIIQNHHPVRWRADPQNVHDSTLSNAVKSQFETIRNENNNYHNADMYLENFLIKNKSNPKVMKVYETIKNRNHYITKMNCTELEFLKHNICRIEQNENNKEELYNILTQNLEDCIEKLEYVDYNNNEIKNESIVCETGVVSKIISSFAHIDESGIGLLKTKQVVRNEIFQECSKIDSEDTMENITKAVDKIIENVKEQNKNEGFDMNNNEYEYIKNECIAAFNYTT
jgi:hypothetical protein